MDDQMWIDYIAFKAAGMLSQWFELYRGMLNLSSPLLEPEP